MQSRTFITASLGSFFAEHRISSNIQTKAKTPPWRQDDNVYVRRKQNLASFFRNGSWRPFSLPLKEITDWDCTAVSVAEASHFSFLPHLFFVLGRRNKHRLWQVLIMSCSLCPLSGCVFIPAKAAAVWSLIKRTHGASIQRTSKAAIKGRPGMNIWWGGKWWGWGYLRMCVKSLLQRGLGSH